MVKGFTDLLNSPHSKGERPFLQLRQVGKFPAGVKLCWTLFLQEQRKETTTFFFIYLEKEALSNTWKFKINLFGNILLLFFLHKYLARCGNRKNPAVALKLQMIPHVECHHKSHISVTGMGNFNGHEHLGVSGMWLQDLPAKLLLCPFPLLHHSNLIFSAAFAVCSNVYQVVLWIHFQHGKASYILHTRVYNFCPFICINSRVKKGRSLCFL